MMSETHDRYLERLSEYMDGSLSADEREEVEAHLEGCGACRRVLEELREVVAAAGRLSASTPPRDLWPGIAAAIRAPLARGAGDEGQVIELPTGRAGGAPEEATQRGVYLTRSQLAAAAVVLMLLSASATWWAGLGVGARSSGTSDGDAPAAVRSATAEAPGAPEALAPELDELEDALEGLRGRLDPNTIRIIEGNLGVIDRAIEESRRALAVDPGNAFLEEHLERAYQRKLSYLREAARIAEWSS